MYSDRWDLTVNAFPPGREYESFQKVGNSELTISTAAAMRLQLTVVLFMVSTMIINSVHDFINIILQMMMMFSAVISETTVSE